MSTKVKVIFSLYSDDLNPEIVTNSLKIEPSASWKKGESLSNKNVLRKEGSWEISTGYQDSLNIEDQLQMIYDIVFPKRERLKELIKHHGLSAKFDIVIKISEGDTPGMSLQRDILNLAYELEAVFDFDVYVN